MQFAHLPGIEKPISRLVMGTVMVSTKDLQHDFAVLDGVFALGCNTFDTAHVYGGGENERGFGQWINSRAIRDKVVIIAKGAHPNQDRKRVTPFDIASDLHDSLARLQTDYIDLYLLHRDDPALPVAPIVESLNEHCVAGRIRAFGGSNWTHQRIAEANEYADKHQLKPFVASSPHFSLALQIRSPWGSDCVTITGPQNASARRWYEQTQTPVFAWSSLASGLMSGRATRDNYKQVLSETAIHAYVCEENFLRVDRACEFAADRGLTVPQVALAYVMNQPMNLFALVATYSPQEMQSNIAALALKLTSHEMAWLNLETD